jgi:hypothetical protein
VKLIMCVINVHFEINNCLLLNTTLGDNLYFVLLIIFRTQVCCMLFIMFQLEAYCSDVKC